MRARERARQQARILSTLAAKCARETWYRYFLKHLNRLERATRELRKMLRREPTDLQCEPSYPGLHTVLISLRDPDLTAHRPSKRCPIEEPHLIAKCGEFQPPE